MKGDPVVVEESSGTIVKKSVVLTEAELDAICGVPCVPSGTRWDKIQSIVEPEVIGHAIR